MFPSLAFPQYAPLSDVTPTDIPLPPLTLVTLDFNDMITNISVQADHKYIASGLFTTVDGMASRGLIRINTDGSLDMTLDIGAGFTGYPVENAVDSLGRIVVAGSMTALDGTSIQRFARLSTTGELDTAFSTAIGTGPNNTVEACTLDHDSGAIYLGGTFTRFNSPSAYDWRMAKVSESGAVDTTFRSNLGAGFNNTVYHICILSDGRIVAVGSFSTIKGVAVGRIAALSSAGVPNTAFNTLLGTGANTTCQRVRELSDGRLLVCGGFTSFNGGSASGLVALNTDGSEDTAFTTAIGSGFNLTVYDMLELPDGRIVVGGYFNTFNGNERNAIVCLFPDGTEDTTFYANLTPGVKASSSAQGTIRTLALQQDRIVVGCSVVWQVADTPRNRLFYLTLSGELISAA